MFLHALRTAMAVRQEGGRQCTKEVIAGEGTLQPVATSHGSLPPLVAPG